MDALLTEAEVAVIVKKPPRTLRQWRWLGTGPRYVKVGRAVRYRPTDLVSWLDQQSSEAA